MTQFV